jgi:tRNA threonylcarbamoyladenosine biosynthesis protein TsaB
MVILALDTTTRTGSVALWRDGTVDERAGDASRTHAERLPGEIASIVADHALTLADIDLYAVLVGPGSFTGMRVGIATIQGLALVHSRSVVGLSALETLAHAGVSRTNAGPGRLVGAWMEAYRGEVFGALYRTSGPPGPRVTMVAPPAVAAPRELAAEWSGWARSAAADAGDPLVIVGDAVPATEAVLRAAFGPDAVLLDAPLLAGTLARLAAANPSQAISPHAIVPLYVRKPDAELARERARAVDAGRGADATPVR